jgi:predicted aminopeptidase
MKGRVLRLLAALALVSAMGVGCATWEDGPGYWLQSATGHLSLMSRAQPVADLLENPATDEGLRERLRIALEIREFASRELALPDNDSYTRYVDVGRPFVVWNVIAARPLSLTLRKWCFPVAGCVSYRGFYSLEDAERFAARMREDGYEAHVGGVPAYSTLGWFADPLLNTFVQHSEIEIARLVFHELAHQRLYLKGDSDFNEAYATAVERAGVERWLARREAASGNTALRRAWQLRTERRNDFLALLRRHRSALEQLFASPLSDDEKLARREDIFDSMRTDYAQLRQQWGGYSGYDGWFAQPLSTARLAAVGTYNSLTPAFEVLLAQQGSFGAFHEAAAALARLPARERSRALAALAAEPVAPLARSPGGEAASSGGAASREGAAVLLRPPHGREAGPGVQVVASASAAKEAALAGP